MNIELFNSNTNCSTGSIEWKKECQKYHENTKNILDEYKKNKQYKDLLAIQESQLSNNEVSLSMLDDLNMTGKRKIEINLNRSRETQYLINLLKVILLVVGCLIVIPILKKYNILTKKMGLLIWGGCLIIIILVVIYLVYIKNGNRNSLDFNEYNFVNPTSAEIAKSKMLLDMTENDQAKCQAFSELKANYDTSDILLDVDQYKNKEKRQCS